MNGELWNLVNNLFMPRLRKIAKSDKEQDVLSIVYTIALLVGVLALAVITLNLIKPMFYEFRAAIINLYALLDGVINSRDEIVMSINDKPIFDFKRMLVDIRIQFINSLRILPVWIVSGLSSVLFLKKTTFKSEIVGFSLIIVSYILSFEIIYQSMLFLLLFVMVLIFYPIGTKLYYNFFQYISYACDVIQNYFESQEKDSKSVSLRKIFLSAIIIIGVCVIFTIKFGLSLDLSLVILFSFILLLWLYQNKANIESYLLKKLLVYVAVFFATVSDFYTGFDLNTFKLPLVILTLFLALNEIVNVFKEFHELIISKSVLFYIEYEDIRTNILLSQKTDLEFIDNYDWSELDLVKQLAIRMHLNLVDEFLELAAIYQKKEFQNYRQFVEGQSYFYNWNDSMLEDLPKSLEIIEKILGYENQKIIWVPVTIKYAVILYHLERYEDSIAQFESMSLYLDIDTLGMLHDSYIKIGDEDKASRLKSQFNLNFEN